MGEPQLVQFPKYTHPTHSLLNLCVHLRMPFNSDLIQAPLPLLGAAWAMEALAVANAQGLSLEPSTNAAGYRGVKITKRSRARPFQASPTSEPTGRGASTLRTLRTLRTLHTLHTLRTLTPDYPT